MSRLLPFVLLFGLLLVSCVPRTATPVPAQPRSNSGASAEKATEPSQVGGPCEYASYPGTITITRVEQTDASKAQAKTNGGPGYEGHEVWFTFAPRSPLAETWVQQTAEKEQLFQLTNSWYPGSKYLEKYNLKAGQTFPGTVKVITKGTCTPILFSFDTLDQADYFESK